jgi:spermidine/putrescine transport system permease protein
MTTIVEATDTTSGPPRRRAGLMAWLLLSPLLLWLVLFVIVPSGIMLVYSFCQRGELGEAKVSFHTQDINGNGRVDPGEADKPPRLTALDNYRRVFDPSFNPRRPDAKRGAPLYLVIMGKAALYGVVIGLMTMGVARATWREDSQGIPTRRRVLRWLAVTVAIGVLYACNDRVEHRIDSRSWDEWAKLVPRAIKYGLYVCVVVAAIGPTRPVRTGLKVGVIAGLLLGFDREIENVVASGNQLKTLWRSVKYAGYTTVICVIVGYPVAYFIGRAREGVRNLLLMVVMIPFWTSFLIRTYAWITILKQEGLLNGLITASHVGKLMESLGLSDTPDFRLDLMYTPTAVMVVLVYSYLPFMILPIYGSVEKMDNAMVEAAFDLGAAPVRAFQHVIIPLTQPGIVAGCLLVFIPAIGMFAIQTLVGGGQVPMIGDVIANQFTKARDWPFGSALGMTLVFMFVVVFYLSSRKKAV